MNATKAARLAGMLMSALLVASGCAAAPAQPASTQSAPQSGPAAGPLPPAASPPASKAPQPASPPSSTVAQPAPAPAAGPSLSLAIVPKTVPQGGTVAVTVHLSGGPAAPQLTVDGAAHRLYAKGPGAWWALIGTDPQSPTGTFTAVARSGALSAHGQYTVAKKSYPTRTVQLSSGQSSLLTQKAGQEEARLAGAALALRTAQPLWRGPWGLPIPGATIDSPYGVFGIYNGKPEWFHEGVDFVARAGTPVMAAAGGTVALAQGLPRGGNTVIINDGQGVLSEYLHLSKLLVKKGERVHRGQTVGLVGATGLATGPGLHFAIFVSGVPVDPLSFEAHLLAQEGLSTPGGSKPATGQP